MLAARYVGGESDVIVPDLIRNNAQALDLYVRISRETRKSIDGMLADGVPAERALYLMPNAFPIRFEESGDLLNFHHKWTTRQSAMKKASRLGWPAPHLARRYLRVLRSSDRSDAICSGL